MKPKASSLKRSRKVMFYQNLRKRHKLSISEMKVISKNSVNINKREYYELYANKFENLDKTDNFLKRHKLPKLKKKWIT